MIAILRCVFELSFERNPVVSHAPNVLWVAVGEPALALSVDELYDGIALSDP